MVKKEVKWKMIEGLDREELALIKLSKKHSDKLKWEHSKEFEYRGEMYDVVYKKETTDSLFYWCWWDHEETQLNKQRASLTKLLLDSDTKRQESTSRIAFFFKSLYSETGENRDEPISTYSKESLFYYSESWASLAHAPPNPPPLSGLIQIWQVTLHLEQYLINPKSTAW